jgi:hypothetical protein
MFKHLVFDMPLSSYILTKINKVKSIEKSDFGRNLLAA